MNRLFVSSLKTLLIVVLCMIVGGCGIGPAPHLTVEDRKADIEYMAKWARDYSPLVKHAEKYIKHPGYEELLPRYLDYAEQAQSNEDFSWVARAYGSVICPKGHSYLVDESLLKWCSLGTFFGIIDLDISPFAVNKALYWTRLSSGIPGSAYSSRFRKRLTNPHLPRIPA